MASSRIFGWKIFGHLIGVLGLGSSVFLIGISLFFPISPELGEWPFKLVISIFLLFNLMASYNWIKAVHKIHIRKMKHSLIFWTVPALSINYCIYMAIVFYIIDSNVPLSDQKLIGVKLTSLCYASAGFLVFYAFAHLNYYLLKKTQRYEKNGDRSDVAYIETNIEDDFIWQREY